MKLLLAILIMMVLGVNILAIQTYAEYNDPFAVFFGIWGIINFIVTLLLICLALVYNARQSKKWLIIAGFMIFCICISLNLASFGCGLYYFIHTFESISLEVQNSGIIIFTFVGTMICIGGAAVFDDVLSSGHLLKLLTED